MIVLKAMGITVTDDTVRQIETLLPQLPGRLNQAVEVINHAVRETHARLDSQQQQLISIRETLEGMNYAGSTAGSTGDRDTVRVTRINGR